MRLVWKSNVNMYEISYSHKVEDQMHVGASKRKYSILSPFVNIHDSVSGNISFPPAFENHLKATLSIFSYELVINRTSQNAR